MNHNKLPVVAAIPNYNMADSLRELLPQLAEQNYAAIFVLDDASIDDSRETVNDFDKNIQFVAGSENVGAGANRNRITEALGFNAIIHFIDADMRLETEHVPELAQEVISSNVLGFIGGLIKDTDGNQIPFNYGPRQCLRGDIGANLHTYISSKVQSDPVKAEALRAQYLSFVTDFPDLLAEPKAKKIFWNAEANLLIRSDVLANSGGFDSRLRDHEIQDLAIRLSNAGLERRFDPALSAVHKAVLVRSGNRNLQMMKAEWQIARKHGLLNWLLPDGKFQPEL